MTIRDDRGNLSRSDQDRGAVLVEFALVAIILVTLVLGSITAGIAFSRNISLNNSARESSRFAATLPVDGDLHVWLNAVADVAIEAAVTDLAASAPGQQVCVSYVYPDGASSVDQTTTLIQQGGSRTITTGTGCFTDTRPGSERRVQVQVARDTTINMGVTTMTKTLAARSIMRFERA